MSPQSQRTDNLAAAFQELITVGERLRSNRQSVSDAASFRAQIWEGARVADRDARTFGYQPEDIELATFAVIAFLDESILNLRHPIFADWPRQPLQEERYGHHVAGEVFFQNLQKLLARTDSAQTGDVLEIYYLCLLLGFAGRYSLGGRGDLREILQQTGEKLQRIRQSSAQISPEWTPGAETALAPAVDMASRLLLFSAIGCALLVVVLFIAFRVALGSGVTTLHGIAGQS
jgi:type VI secretion system protein ImpK